MKSDSFIKNATVITKYVGFMTKCDSYCKMRRLLKNALVHTLALKGLKTNLERSLNFLEKP